MLDMTLVRQVAGLRFVHDDKNYGTELVKRIVNSLVMKARFRELSSNLQQMHV